MNDELCPKCQEPMTIDKGEYVTGENTIPGGYQEPDLMYCDNPECDYE